MFDIQGYLAERQAWWDEKANGIQQARLRNRWLEQELDAREYLVMVECKCCGNTDVWQLWVDSPEQRVDVLVEAGENGIIEEECFDCQIEDWCDILESEDELQDYLDDPWLNPDSDL